MGTLAIGWEGGVLSSGRLLSITIEIGRCWTPIHQCCCAKGSPHIKLGHAAHWGLLNIGYFSNETNTDVHICTLEEFILVEILIHYCTSWNWITEWKITLVFKTMDEKCENCSQHLESSWQKRKVRITFNWETVTLRSQLVKYYLNVCFTPNTFKYQLVSLLTLKFSNFCGNNQMFIVAIRISSWLDEILN